MGLSSGTRLGPYEIVGLLGAGGMGEVYRARDTRLDRTVAIKILSSALTASRESKARFEREARAISSLSHPNICHLYDVGSHDGTEFLVMEYVEGEELSDRLRRGPLPPELLFKTAIELAEGLDKAHRAGIVHRDLKPGNIMLTKTGAKLLDFGLAKSLGSHAVDILGMAASDVAAEPTIMSSRPSSPVTAAGAIVGTIQYMAPEQLEGNEADARTDIFALGAVIYEMATGKPAFPGRSRASVMAAILTSEPQPMTETKPVVPPGLERVVKKCLAKDPDDRWQSAKDLASELKWVAEGGTAAPALTISTGSTWREHVAWGLAACAVIAAVVLAVLYLAQGRAAPMAVRSSILPPENASFVFMGDAAGPVALSPDGSKMAFVAADTGGKSRIYVRPLNAGEARALEGTEGAWAPFWSPDGTRIGFFADGKLKTMSLAGGGATTVCDAPNSRGGSWGKNETIIFAPEFRGAIFRVSASGGTPTAITKVDTAKHTSHRWPIALPDGKHFLYLAINHDIPQDENDAIYYASMDGKESRQLIRSYSNVAYASGFLLFLQNGQLEAQRFDPESGALRGEMKSITTGITEDVSTWRAIFSVSENGLLAYSGSGGAESQLAWVDRSGKLLKTIGEKLEIIGSGVGFRLSPRGDRVAVSVRGAVTDIWVVDVARGVRTRLTFGPVENSAPVWSPDGKWIAFESQVKDGAVIKRKLADGGNEEDVIISGPQLWRDAPFYTNDWSRDGKYLFLMKGGPGARQEIWAMPLFGDRKPFQVLPSGPYFSQYAYLSPNGRWLAYDSNQSARAEVYVTAFPGGQGKRLVSTAGGTHARWSADGKELYYVSLDGTLTAVAVTEKGGQLELGTPQPLFHFAGFGYDVAPDGKKFLISVVNDANTKPITLLMNWTAETRSK